MVSTGSRNIYAIIDVGSKSVRLLVARQLSRSAFEVVDEERIDSRIGEGQEHGRLSPAAIERGLTAMRVVTQVASAYSPTRVVAVGTEALRQATNAHEFIDRAREQTGVTVRILEAREEGTASFLGVVNSTTLDTGTLVDIGGGSLEVMQVSARSLRDVRSVPLGAIYATERFFRSDPPTNKEVRALRKAVREVVPADDPSPVLFGAGGAIRNLVRMVRVKRGYPLRRLHEFTVNRRELQGVLRTLLANDTAGRRKLPGINTDRAATLPAAGVVIDEMMELAKATTLAVSGQGLREGLLWQELRGDDQILRDVRSASIAGLAAANSVDVANAEPEVDVATALFNATRALHKLGDPDLDLLTHAARLAEIGMHVDYYNRDRHAEYLVHSGDLHGFTHREIVLLAGIVRWSMSGTPDLSTYRSILESNDEDQVTILGAILGVARATWRRTPSPVVDVDLSVRKQVVTMHLQAAGPADAEAHAIERQARRLASALKADVRLKVDVR